MQKPQNAVSPVREQADKTTWILPVLDCTRTPVLGLPMLGLYWVFPPVNKLPVQTHTPCFQVEW